MCLIYAQVCPLTHPRPCIGAQRRRAVHVKLLRRVSMQEHLLAPRLFMATVADYHVRFHVDPTLCTYAYVRCSLYVYFILYSRVCITV